MTIDIQTTLATIQAIRGVLTQAGNVEITQQVIDLQSTILALVGENAQKLESITELREEVRSLREALRLKDELRFARNSYWKGDGYDEANGPFCPRCHDVDHKAVRMVALNPKAARCPNCDAGVLYDARESKPPQRQVISRGVGFVDDY